MLTRYQAEEVYKGKAKTLVLGNYILMEKIGSGGMGQVFKTHHRRMDRFVAIKLLPPETTKDKDAIARFEREVKAAAKISHPNIVAAHDADCANGVHFLVMELVEGSDLSAVVKKQGPLSVGKAISYILQAARGLEAAHKKGVIHRDIKPANLLLSTEGTLKILDMGLARLSNDVDAPTQAELTTTGAIMGTVDYMAPEQALSIKSVDGRADIYALGCTLHYLITGKSTYQGDTLMSRLLAHREQPIPSLRAAIADVPEELDLVFRKMVAKKVEDRYQTVTLLIADLEKCNHSHDQTLVIPARNDASKSTTAEVDRLSDLSAAARVTNTRTAVFQSSRPIPPENNRNKFLLGGGLLGILAIAAGIIISMRTKDGTLIVEVDQSNAMVQVLDEEGRIEISQPGGDGKIKISVDPGKHRLKVVKDGFTTYGQEFEMEKNGKKEITARLEPLGEKPAMVATPSAASPAPSPPVPVPVPTDKKLMGYQMPGFDQWVKVVVALPAEEQIQVVAQKLQELNPGFDGKVTPSIGEGIVISMDILVDHVTDLSPLRALPNLSYLECLGSPPCEGKLVDLSPLQGLSLRGLWCSHTKIADLSPLKGMPIKRLTCQSTSISDLSPLSGMPLKNLRCTSTKVADLTPLQGMQLAELHVEETLITNLWALKGMQLTSLAFSGTQVSDIAPLRGMPLSTLICSHPVSDFSLLKEMPLKNLYLNFQPERDTELLRSIKTLETINNKPAAEFWKTLDAKQPLAFQMPGFDEWVKDVAAMPAEQQVDAVSKKLVELNPGFDGKYSRDIENDAVVNFVLFTSAVTDISPVRAFPNLANLNCIGGETGDGKLTDLSPLNGLKLTSLFISNNKQVSDLSPLKGQLLSSLRCENTSVPDLSPLQGMPLLELFCSDKVVDLTPLKGMPLTTLNCHDAKVADLTPLHGMPLTYLNIPGTPVSDLSPLMSMKLTYFCCVNTLVSDLSPLHDMPLKQLSIHASPVTDTSPIRGMPLESITLDFKPDRDTDLLRSIKTLKTINDKSAAEFLKDATATP